MTTTDTATAVDRAAQVRDLDGQANRVGWAAVIACGLGMAVVGWAIVARIGTFGYALDDPYIHLSLAETILRGGYGINPGEYASPSSSIAYPFLVAVTLALGFGSFGPLVLNVAAALGAAFVLGHLLGRALERANGGVSAWAYPLVPLLLLASHGYGLAFVGMEHTLHVLASLAIVLGLSRMTRDGPVHWVLIAGVLAAPLLRFEGLAFSGAALVALAAFGRWRLALGLGAALAGLLGIYVLAMQSMGLPPLPSSVLVKSGTSAAAIGEASFLAEVMQNLRDLVGEPRAQWVLFGSLALIVPALWPGLPAAARVTAAATAAAGLAHCVAGSWSIFPRYGIYLVASVLAAWLVVLAALPIAPARRVWFVPLIAAVCLWAGQLYLVATRLMPPAAQNIHDQQYQMHRFSTGFFRDPVAVNDLGWTSYRNEAAVLDLWGLGSEEVRRLTAAGKRTPEALRDLTYLHRVSYAMLFTDWFDGQLPPEWCRIATLRTISIVTPFDHVDFYLVDPARGSDMRAALSAWAPSLPASASVEIHACDP
ncbi:hypothetical protein [Pseudooceanicola sp. LIPI14-2-Ac024]|uniref:hypothetical protein n=1 Tax=Pseudooceanicola sp. LIPI14-2-Ac024 TaxID=3344875 RepID=UPI0035D12362